MYTGRMDLQLITFGRVTKVSQSSSSSVSIVIVVVRVLVLFYIRHSFDKSENVPSI